MTVHTRLENPMSTTLPTPRQQTAEIKKMVDDKAVRVSSRWIDCGRVLVTTIDLWRADSRREAVRDRLAEAGYRVAEAESFLQITRR